LNATVLQRQKFMALIERESRLEHVEIAHWAGLGGVRYIPSEFVDKKEDEKKDGEQGEKDSKVDAVSFSISISTEEFFIYYS